MRVFVWIGTLLLGSWSLLAVFRAPAYRFFLPSLLAKELGHFLAVACFGLSVASGRGLARALLVSAGAAFLSPIIRALGLARKEGFRVAFRPPVWKRAKPMAGPVAVDVNGLAVHWYKGAGGRRLPVAILVHGGGWEGGVARENEGLNWQLASEGIHVFAPEYRLSPRFQWPSQREDIESVISALGADPGRYGIDPSRIVLIGRSAGGQIASAVAARHPHVAGCICLYAPFDMFFAYEHGREDDFLRSRRLLRSYLGGDPESAPENYRSASAYHLVDANSPPLLLIHGRKDELVWEVQSRRFTSRLQSLGVPCTYLRLPWATHAFDFVPGSHGCQITMQAIRRFFQMLA